MRQSFWKATAISVAAYGGAILLGIVADFRFTLFLLLALQITWTLFCVIRAVQLRAARRAGAEPFEREAYGFALGGSISSVVLLAVMVVLTQVV